MLKKIIYWIRRVAQKVTGIEKISEVAKNDTVISTEMTNAIDMWMELYQNKCPWLNKDDRTLCLPAAVSSEIARLVTLEMKVEITGSDRANYLNEQLDPLRNDIRTQCEYGCAGGGLIMKPYLDGNQIAIDCVHADAFYPLAFSKGKITACAFIEQIVKGKTYYNRIEKQFLGDNGTYYVENKAYKSSINNDLGSECSLTDVDEWRDIQPEVTLSGVNAPLFGYFKIPIGNTVDDTSPLGVSVYSRAIGNIRDADRIYQSLLWEFEAGEMAIDASSDVFKEVDGVPLLPIGRERLFRMNNLDSMTAQGNELMKSWTPTLRDSSFKNGLNVVLQKVEFNCGLAYGTFSDPQIVDKTAEEIKSSKQRSASTVKDIQKSFQNALDALIYSMDVYATLYKLAPEGKYSVSYCWDDSIVVDSVTEREIDRQDCRDGAMMWWEYRVKWRGEDEETAKMMTGFYDEKTDEEVMGFDNKNINEDNPQKS